MMEVYPPNRSHRLTTVRLHKWSAGLTAMLLSSALILSACGGDSETPAEAEATVAATEAAPAATEAVETPEAEATEVIETETGLITETEVLTETEVTTDVDVSEVTTETVVMTDTAEGGGETSEVITETEVMTEGEEVDDGAAVDDSEAVTETSAPETGLDTETFGVTGIDDEYVRASTLLDYDFDNMDGEVSGDLEDLLIDLATGRVLFASIEYGGVLDLGDKDIVVPLNAFAVGPDGELILNIDETALESYPDVGNDWPNLEDPTWDDAVATFWNDTGINSGLNFEEPSTTVAWASDLIGDNVADLGAGAGSVLDILVNLGTGNATYLVVDYGEGLDTDPYIIPISAYDFADWQDEFVYRPDFTPDVLVDAPRFDEDAYPEGRVDKNAGDRFESWWNDMGFSNDLNNDGEVD